MRDAWDKQSRQPVSQDVYEAEVARHWRDAGCAAAGGPRVAAALARRLKSRRFSPSPLSEGSPYPAQLAAAFLTESCAGAKGLPAEIVADLKQLVASVPRTPAAPTTPSPSR